MAKIKFLFHKLGFLFAWLCLLKKHPPSFDDKQGVLSVLEGTPLQNGRSSCIRFNSGFSIGTGTALARSHFCLEIRGKRFSSLKSRTSQRPAPQECPRRATAIPHGLDEGLQDTDEMSPLLDF